MNNIFNAKRFGRLLKKTLLERPVQLFGFTGLILVLILITYAVAKALIWYNAAQNLSFIWGLPVGGAFMASFVFAYFSSNASGSSFLTLPASNFEKWLCGILIAGVFYPIIFLVFFRVMDTSFVTLYHNSLDPNSPFYKNRYESVYIFPFDGIIAWKVYPMFLLLTGAMLSAPLFFNKLGFIKMALAISLLVVACVGLNWLLAKAFFGSISDAAPFNHVTIPVGKESGSIELPETTGKIYRYTLSYIVPPVLWGLAFIRLREKEF